jgi:NADH:ubiquinone oxidoreductase subunit C
VSKIILKFFSLFNLIKYGLYKKDKTNEIITTRSKSFILLNFLKYHTNTQFNLLTDIIAVDEPQKHFRFEVIYHILSLHFNERLVISLRTNELNPISSITGIYKNAN